jgi:hypothetical protein
VEVKETDSGNKGKLLSGTEENWLDGNEGN